MWMSWKRLVSVIVKLERTWPHFLFEANHNTLLGWGKSGSEKHYLNEGNRKKGREWNY